MLRLTALVACLAGCDTVWDFERPGYSTDSDLGLFRVDLARDATPDTIVLDRRRTQQRVHVIPSGYAADFGAGLVTIAVDFTPLSVTSILLGYDRQASLLVGGERDGAGALAVIPQHTAGVFDAPIDLGVPDATGAITSIETTDPTAPDRYGEIMLVSAGRALVTQNFSLDEPTLSMVMLEGGLSKTAMVHTTDDRLWVADDDHVTFYATATLAGSPPQSWTATPANRRAISTNGNLGVGGRLHAFSTRCSGTSCTVRWDAVSPINETTSSFEIPISHAAVSGVVISEVEGAHTGSDVVVFGIQADGDEIATELPDLDFDGTTFHVRDDLRRNRFPRPCLGTAQLAAISTAPLDASPRESILMLDTGGRGYAIDPDGACLDLSLQLP